MLRSDEELMLSYRDGDERAFEMLYRRYERPLLNFIYRMVMDASDAENLCQEAFFRVMRGRKKYRATAQFKTWLFQIAANLWISYYGESSVKMRPEGAIWEADFEEILKKMSR